jgi:hypothetical protein
MFAPVPEALVLLTGNPDNKTVIVIFIKAESICTAFEIYPDCSFSYRICILLRWRYASFAQIILCEIDERHSKSCR